MERQGIDVTATKWRLLQARVPFHPNMRFGMLGV